MLRRQAFKFELMPDGDQARDRRRFAGSCRFVFNKALAMQQERHAAGEKKLGYAGLCKCLTEWRNSPETPWLADAPMHPLQQTLKDLERAYANFFAKRADFPRFKKKGRSDDSFRYPDPQQFRLDHVSVAQENRQTQAPVRGRGMRLRGKRRSGRRHQCVKGGTRPASLWRYFARWSVGPGTRRSDYAQACLRVTP